MSGDMHAVRFPFVDTCADFVKGVNDPVHRSLVTGDRARRQYYGVASLDADRPMLPRRDQCECGKRFSLGTGTDDNGLVGGIVVDVGYIEEKTFGDADGAEVPADFHISNHRTPHESNTPSCFRRGIAHLLD